MGGSGGTPVHAERPLVPCSDSSEFRGSGFEVSGKADFSPLAALMVLGIWVSSPAATFQDKSSRLHFLGHSGLWKGHGTAAPLGARNSLTSTRTRSPYLFLIQYPLPDFEALEPAKSRGSYFSSTKPRGP